MELSEKTIGDIAFVTKLAGFEHTKYIQGNCVHEKHDDSLIPLFIGKTVRDGKIDKKFDWYIPKQIAHQLPRSLLKRKCLVLPYVGTIGDLAVFDASYEALLGSNIAKIELNPDCGYSEEFVYYYLKSPRGQSVLLKDEQGGIQKNITMEAIRNVLLPIVDEIKQEKIVAVLSALDDKIALNKKMNQKLESMAKRLYDYWFVQFDFPDENGRPYKTSGGPMTHNPTLNREIPEGWGVALVSDVINPIERGISYTSEDIENTSGIPMINLACFDKKGNYRTGELKFYSGEFGESNKVYPLDMLIACTDLTQKADIIGTPIFLSAESPFYVFSTDLAKISPRDELHKYFLYYYLKDPTFHRYIKPFASGTTVKHLNVKGVENYPIFIPMENVVKQFTDMVCPIVKSINERINEINKLSALRDKLLPLLMNGQVEVC